MLKTCDVCTVNGGLYVRSSATGPMSFAYCEDCLTRLAEPEWTFEFLYADVGNEGEGLAEWVKDMTTFKDGKYWTWNEWKTWRKTEPSYDIEV